MVGWLTASMGLHLALLQSVAWTFMLAGFLRSGDSFPAALGKTFDGHHPCRLCVWVRGKAASPSQDASPRHGQPDLPKLELARPSSEPDWLPPEPGNLRVPPASWFASTRTFRPPVPPPRASRS